MLPAASHGRKVVDQRVSGYYAAPICPKVNGSTFNQTSKDDIDIRYCEKNYCWLKGSEIFRQHLSII
jgi:hypothetical protein